VAFGIIHLPALEQDDVKTENQLRFSCGNRNWG